MNILTSKALLKKLRSKKKNGFTLIVLMVVVAIVGILSAVGLPELTKAQDRAKDATATATITNAAKECSLSLIMNGDATDYNSAAADGSDPATGWAAQGVSGNCAANTVLEITSESGNTVALTFVGSTPGTAEVTEVE